MAVKVSADNFAAEVLQSKIPALVDFYADGCIPCRRLSPILAELEEEAGGAWKLCKVNVGANLPLAQRCGVLSAPTIIAFRDGEERARHPGFLEKDAVTEILNQILEG
ncbi:MAG: thioredoxin family protein [Oscillospiraceae bacterium]|jgi:thioredoxin 1|nr:thioredoxin family protein [Oscillospiraceae bacterium]